MRDRQDDHPSTGLIDLVDDPIVTAVGAVLALQLEPQGSPDPIGTLGEQTIDGLDHRRGDPRSTGGR